MSLHPRIRNTVKWAAASVVVLLIGAWTLSAWYDLAWGSTRHGFVDCGVGAIHVLYHQPTSQSFFAGWRLNRLDDENPMEWWFGATTFSSGTTWCAWIVPMWFPLLVVGSFTIWMWRVDTLADRRARVGGCPTCSYDRTGLPTVAVCPECGNMPA